MKLELSNKIIIRTTSEGIVYVHGIKLSEIIDEYGTERYSEGESDEYSRNADADY